MISFIGTNNKEMIDEKIAKVNSATIRVSYLDSTELSVQYICDTDDIKSLMGTLSKIVLEKPKA